MNFKNNFSKIADEVYIEPVMNWNNAEAADLLQEYSKISDYPKKLNSESVKFACPSPFYTLVIHSDLKVSPCWVD